MVPRIVPVNPYQAPSKPMSQEESISTSTTSPTMNLNDNNMLSEILKTQFFSDEANQAAITAITEKYKELRKILDAARTRTSAVESALYSDLVNLNAAINRNDVTEIKRILAEFKDTTEYVDTFLKNKIGSIYEPSDEEFDVSKKFNK